MAAAARPRPGGERGAPAALRVSVPSRPCVLSPVPLRGSGSCLSHSGPGPAAPSTTGPGHPGAGCPRGALGWGGRPVALLAVGGASGPRHSRWPARRGSQRGEFTWKGLSEATWGARSGVAWRPEVGFPSRSEASNRSANPPRRYPLPRRRASPLVPGAYGGCPYLGMKTLEAEALAAGIEGGPAAPRGSGPGILEVPWLPESLSLAVESSRLRPGLYSVSQAGSARSPDPDSAPSPEFRLHLQLEAGLVIFSSTAR